MSPFFFLVAIDLILFKLFKKSKNGLNFPQKSENGLIFPKKSENGLNFPKKSENGLIFPKKSENGINFPKKSENGLNFPKKSEIAANYMPIPAKHFTDSDANCFSDSVKESYTEYSLNFAVCFRNECLNVCSDFDETFVDA